MPMMDSQSAGPIMGDEDGRMMPQEGAPPQGEEVPCPACQGIGMVPPEQAQQIAGMMGQPEEMPDEEMGQMEEMGAPGGPPESPVTGRTAEDMAGIRDYAANRPAHLQHQPLDEGAVASSGKRVRERMRQSGLRGG